jgi:hypothetical protein
VEKDVRPSFLELEVEEVNFHHHQEHHQSQNVFFQSYNIVSISLGKSFAKALTTYSE